MRHRLIFAAVVGWVLSACIGQASECQKYLNCAEDLSPGSRDALNPEYGPEGTCWKLTATAAAACADACAKALSDAGSQAGAPASCAK